MSPCLRWAGMNLGMNVSAWLETVTIALRLAQWQQFGLAFLLGSFAVATWSDLKRLSAQREFVEIWILFLLAILGLRSVSPLQRRPGRQFDRCRHQVGTHRDFLLALVAQDRHSIITGAGRRRRVAAAASLLPPILVVIFYFLAKVLAMIVGPLLARGRPIWPFMPVVSLSTIGILALGWLV